jgi:hypothetical protein
MEKLSNNHHTWIIRDKTKPMNKCSKCNQVMKPEDVLARDFLLNLTFCWSCWSLCTRCNCRIGIEGPYVVLNKELNEPEDMFCSTCHEEYALYSDIPCPSGPSGYFTPYDAL